MAYQDYKWALADAPMWWRVAELWVRQGIGLGWALALYSSLTYFFPPSTSAWSFIGFLLIAKWGLDLSMPERR